MEYSEIHKALKKHNYNWSVVARAMECTPSHVMSVAKRTTHSKRIALAISAMINEKVEDVFPDMPSYQKDRATERAQIAAQARAKIDQALAS